MSGERRATVALECGPMTAGTRADAAALLRGFLREDAHYLESADAYGDGGAAALAAALDLFLDRPAIGFVWLAYAIEPPGRVPVGVCVVCRAISTSRGTVVAKLDDVAIAPHWRGRGVGSAMLAQLAQRLRLEEVRRIDTACHRDNAPAWRFYARLGFVPLHEERIAWLI